MLIRPTNVELPECFCHQSSMVSAFRRSRPELVWYSEPPMLRMLWSRSMFVMPLRLEQNSAPPPFVVPHMTIKPTAKPSHYVRSAQGPTSTNHITNISPERKHSAQGGTQFITLLLPRDAKEYLCNRVELNLHVAPLGFL